MDSFREHPDDFEAASSLEVNAANDVAAAIGTDERRMHVRAYNHWVSLLEGRDFPSIEDLDPANVEDFATINAVYARFMPDPPPARSAPANVVLPRGLLISIDAIAVLPSA